MHSPALLLEFDNQGDIHVVPSNDNDTQSHCQCLLLRYILHQISLILSIIVYLILGGLFFASVESQYYLRKDVERKEITNEAYENIRRFAIHLLNEQLNEDFENAYQRWRWESRNLSHYICLNPERITLLDNRTASELEHLFLRLAMQHVAVDKFVYKWTYSTAILYAATLVTTIGYGNIAPKTPLGKVFTVIYALFGILLVVSWLKLVGESLALLVTRYYRRLRRCFQTRKGKRMQARKKGDPCQKVPFYVPIILLMLYLLAGSLLFATWEGWSYIDGAYFSFITFTTIGFGDLVPGESTISHRSGRSIICAMYLLFGVLLTAMSFNLVQEDIDRMKTRLLQRLGIEHEPLSPRIKN